MFIIAKQLSLSEQLQYSTVRIECLENNKVVSTGTGFFYKFLEKEDGSYIPAIVTNKHVVKNARQGRFLITLADSSGGPDSTRYLPVMVEDFEKQWINHPEQDVDLCILPIGAIFNELSETNKEPFFIGIDKNIMPTKEQLSSLGALEDIVMIGYPNGIWDSVNNLPILRKGTTATHPNKDYNGKEEFMIDAACFPGSSGSPVFIYNEGAYGNGPGLIMGSRLRFLGILYAGPQFTAQGEIHVVNIPTDNREVVLSRIPNNLGLIIKAEKLLDFDAILRKHSFEE